MHQTLPWFMSSVFESGLARSVMVCQRTAIDTQAPCGSASCPLLKAPVHAGRINAAVLRLNRVIWLVVKHAGCCAVVPEPAVPGLPAWCVDQVLSGLANISRLKRDTVGSTLIKGALSRSVECAIDAFCHVACRPPYSWRVTLMTTISTLLLSLQAYFRVGLD